MPIKNHNSNAYILELKYRIVMQATLDYFKSSQSADVSDVSTGMYIEQLHNINRSRKSL